MLVNNQLVCLPPVGIFKPIIFVSLSVSGMPVKLDVAKCIDQYKEQHWNICFENAVQCRLRRY